MSTTKRAVAVENLSKVYNINALKGRPSETLIGHLLGAAVSPVKRVFRRGESAVAKGENQHWALRDINFSVPEGQAVGLIGHNGAGKSTLLKILSRITHPTSGVARVRGRMASLLEVGTGFHPDLTGRDNVFFNGAVLGMSRQDIARRFEQIVDFSGVEEYIDTPIKYYSSGMKVRLAFAVAAHLEPDILVVDEVLAVGDAAFQRKCLNRVEEAGSEGRTVLFVSHQLNTVVRLCSRALVLNQGEVVFDGGTLEAVNHYGAAIGTANAQRIWGPADAPGDDIVRMTRAEIRTGGEFHNGPISTATPVEVNLQYVVDRPGWKLRPVIHLFDSAGVWVFTSVDTDPQWADAEKVAGSYQSTVVIPANLLNEGTYSVAVTVATVEPSQVHCFVTDCLSFTTYDAAEEDNARGTAPGNFIGVIRPLLEWHTERA